MHRHCKQPIILNLNLDQCKAYLTDDMQVQLAHRGDTMKAKPEAAIDTIRLLLLVTDPGISNFLQ